MRMQFDTLRRNWAPLVFTCALFALPLTMIPLDGFAAETPEVMVELERQEVFVGESVLYRVLLNHCSMEAEPDLPDLDDIDVKLDGKIRVAESTRMSINGRRENVQIRNGPLYEYRLTPRKAGNYVVPGPRVVVAGKTYSGPALQLKVAAVDAQDLVYLDVTTEPKSVYPLQPLQLRLTVAVKGLPDPASATDPLQLERPLPALTIPWADDEQLADGLEPKQTFDKWLQPYLGRAPIGMAVNDLKSRADPFEFFGSRQNDRRHAFRPKPNRVVRQDGQGRQVEYWEYLFERTVIPQRAGTFSLGGVTLKGQFAHRINTRGNVELKMVYALAPPLELVVKSPPLAGRPASYQGAIGRFTCGAELTPREASVGDPLTLTLWIRGTGTLGDTQAPDLGADPAITEQFKVYEATEETDLDTRRFTYSLRPKSTAATEFPAIPISYFDVNEEKYVTLQTQPIPLAIAAASQLASSEIAMAAGATGAPREIGTLSDGIFANVTDLSQLRHDGVNPNRWFFNLGTLASLFVVVAFVAQRVQRSREDTGLQRRRGALVRARRRIEAVGTDDVADGVSGALVGLVADLCDRDEEGLTSADAAAGLASRNVAPELVSRLTEVLETCDAMRYASDGSESDSLKSRTESLFDDLAVELRNRKLVS